MNQCAYTVREIIERSAEEGILCTAVRHCATVVRDCATEVRNYAQQCATVHISVPLCHSIAPFCHSSEPLCTSVCHCATALRNCAASVPHCATTVRHCATTSSMYGDFLALSCGTSVSVGPGDDRQCASLQVTALPRRQTIKLKYDYLNNELINIH